MLDVANCLNIWFVWKLRKCHLAAPKSTSLHSIHLHLSNSYHLIDLLDRLWGNIYATVLLCSSRPHECHPLLLNTLPYGVIGDICNFLLWLRRLDIYLRFLIIMFFFILFILLSDLCKRDDTRSWWPYSYRGLRGSIHRLVSQVICVIWYKAEWIFLVGCSLWSQHKALI